MKCKFLSELSTHAFKSDDESNKIFSKNDLLSLAYDKIIENFDVSSKSTEDFTYIFNPHQQTKFNKNLKNNQAMTKEEFNLIQNDDNFREEILSSLENSIRKDLIEKLCTYSLLNILEKCNEEKSDILEFFPKKFTSKEILKEKRERSESKILTCGHPFSKHYAKV